MSSKFNIPTYLKHMGDVDPDFRQMALFDFKREIEAQPAWKPATPAEEREIVNTVIKTFSVSEQNYEVQSNAIHLVPALAPRISGESRDRILTECARVLFGKLGKIDPKDPPSEARIDALRSNAALAIKGVVESVRLDGTEGPTMTTAFAAIVADLNEAVIARTRIEAFDIIVTVLKRGGARVPADALAKALAAAVKDLDAENPTLRSRSSVVIAHLSQFIQQAEFDGVIHNIVAGLARPDGDAFRNRARLCSAMARLAGDRFADRVQEIAPLLEAGLQALGDDDKPESDDTRENILQAFENFVARCPAFLSAETVASIHKRCVDLLAWDPNFVDLEEAADAYEGYEDDGYGDYGMEDVGAYGSQVLNDADSSWKVRNAAASTLTALLRSRAEAFEGLFVPQLIATSALQRRLKERVDSTLQHVLRLLSTAVEVGRGGAVPQGSVVKKAVPALAPLAAALPSLITPILAKLKTTTAAPLGVDIVNTLTVLVSSIEVPADQLAATASSITASATAGGVLSTPQLSEPFVVLLAAIFARLAQPHLHGFPAVDTTFDGLVSRVTAAVADRNVRTATSAVAALGQVVATAVAFPEWAALPQRILDAALGRVRAGDCELEVRRASFDVLAALIRKLPAIFNQTSTTQLVQDVVAIATNTANRDALRADALNVLAAAATLSANLHVGVVDDAVTKLAALLKQPERQITEKTLRALIAFATVGKGAAAASPAVLVGVVQEVAVQAKTLMADADSLFIALLTVQLLRVIAAVPEAAKQIAANSDLMSRALALAVSGGASAAAQVSGMCRAVAKVHPELLASIRKELDAAAGAQADSATYSQQRVVALAQILGAVTASALTTGAADASALVTQWKGAATSKGAAGAAALAAIAEVGRCMNLETAIPGAADALIAALSDEALETRTDVATALGRAASSLAAGTALLKKLVAALHPTSRGLYFVARAIRDALAGASADAAEALTAGTEPADASEIAPGVAAPLMTASAAVKIDDDNAVATLLGEAVGRAALLAPAAVLPIVRAAATAANAADATVFVALVALRFAVTGSAARPAVRDALVSDATTPAVAQAGLTAGHSQATLRAALQLVATAVTTLGTAAGLTEHHVQRVIECAAVDASQVEVIDLGPIKHRRDRGLEARKAAVEALRALVDTSTGSATPGACLQVYPHASKVVDALLTAGSLTADPDMDVNGTALQAITLALRVPVLARLLLQPDGFERVCALAASNVLMCNKVPEKDKTERMVAMDAGRNALVLMLRVQAAAPGMHSAKVDEAVTAAKKLLPGADEWPALQERAKASEL